MKKLILLFLLLTTLSGCSISQRTNITGLLSAPKRSETESEIVNVISDYLGENITLKYSSSQGYTSPIQLIDITGDKTNEAVVFYHAPNKGTNIRFALLEYTDEKWNMVFDKEGLGSDVFYFDAVKFPDMVGKQIAVGYLVNGINENFFVTYFTEVQHPRDDYVEMCEDVVTKDLDGDGFKEILLTGSQSDGKVKIKALTMSAENGCKIVGTKVIRRGDVKITQLQFAETDSGKTAVYVDYRDSANYIYTEAFTFEGSVAKNILCREAVSRAWPDESALNSQDMDGDGVPEIPVIIENNDNNMPDETEEHDVNFFIQWTDFSGQQEIVKMLGVYNTQNNMFMALPPEWQGQTYIKRESYGWSLMSLREENVLVKVTEGGHQDDIKSGDYSYIVHKDAKSWIVEFGKEADSFQMEYMIKNIAVFD